MPDTLQRTRDLYQAVTECYSRMDEMLAWSDDLLLKRVPDVSHWSIAQQVEHTAVSTGLMLTAATRICAEQEPAESDGSINLVGRAILRAGRMPRGKAQAPDRSKPGDAVGRQSVERALRRSRQVHAGIDSRLEEVAASTWKVRHPYFDWLDARQWLRLAAVHADHHFRIIDDIQAA